MSKCLIFRLLFLLTLVVTRADSMSSSRMKMETSDGGRLSPDISALHVHPADQDMITSSSREKFEGAVSSKIQGAPQSANSRVRPSSSVLSGSDGTGAASTSADNGLSRTSSVNSFSSEKSTLNPHAKARTISESSVFQQNEKNNHPAIISIVSIAVIPFPRLPLANHLHVYLFCFC